MTPRDLASHPPSVWSVDGTVSSVRREGIRLVRSIGSLRIMDMLLFALMFANVVPVPGGHSSEFFLGALVVLALFRRPRLALGTYGLLVPLAVLALGYIAMVSLFAPVEVGAADWRLRLLRVAAVTMMVFIAATGRIDLRSGITGVLLVCAVNVPLFYAGLVQNSYDGYLTGVFGDKNFAGLVYATFGILSTSLTRRVPYRVILYLAFAAPVWLTGSRTTVAAYLLAGVWMVIGWRLNLIGKALLGAATAWVVNATAEDFSQVGVFSDRVGSDLLRSRIDAASRIKVDESGFFGQGLGHAFVNLQDRSWFFHNSYWTALVEGGWPWAVFVVGLTVLILLRPMRRGGAVGADVAVGAGIVLLVTSTRLGEVLYTLPWGVALAFGLRVLLVEADASAPGDDVPDAGSPGSAGIRPADSGAHS